MWEEGRVKTYLGRIKPMYEMRKRDQHLFLYAEKSDNRQSKNLDIGVARVLKISYCLAGCPQGTIFVCDKKRMILYIGSF